MKSKFKNKIVFWDDKYFKNNRDKSSYWFVLDVEKEYRPKLNGGDRIVIKYIDRYGNRSEIKTTQHYLYKKMKIIHKDLKLEHDFIESIFRS